MYADALPAQRWEGWRWGGPGVPKWMHSAHEMPLESQASSGALAGRHQSATAEAGRSQGATGVLKRMRGACKATANAGPHRAPAECQSGSRALAGCRRSAQAEMWRLPTLPVTNSSRHKQSAIRVASPSGCCRPTSYLAP